MHLKTLLYDDYANTLLFILTINQWFFVCVCPVGSTCCSYAGRHTTCREYCQAIFRTDSTPTVSQINAVKEYCQSHSTQLLNCVSNFTESYPIRSPIDSKCVRRRWASTSAERGHRQ